MGVAGLVWLRSGMPRRPLLALLTVVAGPCVLAGCGDPPPDPATAPIEVILPGCTVNRPSIAPGDHDLSVVGTGAVRVLGPDHSELLAVDGPTSTPATLTMQDTGLHTVSCVTDAGEPKATTLRVEVAK